MTSEIPILDAPKPWKSALGEWDLPDADAVLAAYLDEAHPVHRLAVDDTIDEIADFGHRLRDALSSPSRSAVVHYPEDASPTVAAVLVGEVLGGIGRAIPAPIFGPVEVDAPSSGPRSNIFEQVDYVAGKEPDYRATPSPWHTDSVLWRTPARWAVLGCNHCDPAYADAPTEVVPLHRLLATWQDDPVHLDILRTTAVDWRQDFNGLGELRAPVLGSTVLRWLSIALPDEFAHPDSPIGRACVAFDRHLNQVENAFKAYLATGLLVVDNHRAIHRGPVVEQGHLRRILKVKIGGLPEG